MKLSESTLTILKNFAAINQSILFKPGYLQKTLHQDSIIVGEAILSDDFPVEFGIYNLSEFLANHTALGTPDLVFDDTFLTMKGNNISLKYFYCAPNLIKTPKKNFTIDNPDVTVKLSQDIFQKLLKIGTLNGFTNLTITGKDGKLKMRIHTPTNDGANSAEYDIEDYSGDDFVASFKIEYIDKMIPASYNVKIALNEVAQFVNDNATLTYFVPLDTKDKKKGNN